MVRSIARLSLVAVLALACTSCTELIVGIASLCPAFGSNARTWYWRSINNLVWDPTSDRLRFRFNDQLMVIREGMAPASDALATGQLLDQQDDKLLLLKDRKLTLQQGAMASEVPSVSDSLAGHGQFNALGGIVFTSAPLQASAWNLFVDEMRGQEPRQLATNLPSESFAVSPDRARIVYFKPLVTSGAIRRPIAVRSLLADDERVIFHGGEFLGWADNDTLLFAFGEGAATVAFSLQSGTDRQFWPSLLTAVRAQPDARRVAIVETRYDRDGCHGTDNERVRLGTVTPSGSDFRLLVDSSSLPEPRASFVS